MDSTDAAWDSFSAELAAERGTPASADSPDDVVAFLAHELGWRHREIGQLVMWRSRGDATPEEVADAEAELAAEWEALAAVVEARGGVMPASEVVRARVMGEP